MADTAQMDWKAIVADSRFQALDRKKTVFLWGLMVFSVVYYVMERAYGSFERAIALPRYVDPNRAEAHFSNGVLTVRVPKVPGAGPRRVPVR